MREEISNVFRRSLPKNQRNSLSDEMIEEIINIANEDDFEADEFINQLVSFSNILLDGKYKLRDYVKALQFCTYRNLGLSIQNAYEKTFPEKVKRRILENKADSTFQSASSMYSKGILVQKILTQSSVPIRLFFNKERFEALRVLADLMINAKSKRTRMDSADKLLNHLKDPEEYKIELDVGIKQSQYVEELEHTITSLAQKQLDLIASGGYSVKHIASSKIVETEVVDVERI